MASTKMLHIRIDPELKSQAEAVLSEIGLPTSTAITLFLRSVVRYGGIPFELRVTKPETMDCEEETTDEEAENTQQSEGNLS